VNHDAFFTGYWLTPAGRTAPRAGRATHQSLAGRAVSPVTGPRLSVQPPLWELGRWCWGPFVTVAAKAAGVPPRA